MVSDKRIWLQGTGTLGFKSNAIAKRTVRLSLLLVGVPARSVTPPMSSRRLSPRVVQGTLGSGSYTDTSEG